MHHSAISAEIEPAFFRIARNGDTGGADESAAVQLMHLRHRELEHVDGVAGHSVLEHRSSFHDARRNRSQRVEFFLEPADQLQSDAVHRQSRHQCKASIRSLLAEENAKTLGIAFDLVEEQRWNRARALAIDQLRHGADFQIPIGALDAFELAHRFDQLEPLPHVLIRPRHVAFVQRLGSFPKAPFISPSIL